jgi:cardiolipin synthase
LEAVAPPVTGLGGLFRAAFRMFAASGRLRRSLVLWLTVGLVLSEGFAVALALLHDHDSVLPVVLGDLGCWLVVTLFFVGGAAMLRTPDGIRLDHYGLPNGLTAVRAWLSFPLILAAALSLPGATGLYIWCVVGGCTGMLDFVDGFIARRFGPVTALGKAFDPAMDVVFFTMAAIGNFLLGILPGWLAAAIVIRYLGPFMFTPVVFLTGRRPELVHTTWGRRNTAAIGLVMFILMFVRISGGPVQAVAIGLSIPLLLPTFLLHVVALLRRTVEAPTAG